MATQDNSSREEQKFSADDMRDFAEYYRKTQGNVPPDMWGKDLFECWKASRSKEKEPLFTTEDGEKLFEGDKMCLLNTLNWHTYPNVAACKKPFTGINGEFKYFSKEQIARTYIEENKPVLSAIDVINISEWYSGLGNTEHRSFHVAKLLALAKSKL